jgi:hypothetical protein
VSGLATLSAAFEVFTDRVEILTMSVYLQEETNVIPATIFGEQSIAEAAQ